MSNDATSRNVEQGMARLKELLFDSESQTLNQIERRLGSMEADSARRARESLETVKQIEQMFDRAGTEERFRQSVASVLDKALQDAELRNHDEMSRAMAPLVVNTIKTELRNSQDELVDIMFPITGRMVKSYISAEMKKLSESVNNQIDRNPVMLRLRSLTSGRPVSDLAIASTQHLVVDEVFLIRRGTGELLAHWPPSAAQMSNADIHMSGVLAAINDFASSSFADDGGNFESFRYDAFQVYMRASPVYLLAAKCNGIAPSGIESIFDEEFIATLERVGALEKAALSTKKPVTALTRSGELRPLADGVEARTGDIYEEIERSSIGGAISKALLFMIAVPLLAWFFWGLYTDAEEAIVRRQAQHVIDNTAALEGYQTDLVVGYRGRSITVSGLAPNEQTRDALSTALARELGRTSITARIAVIPATRIAPEPVDTQPIERRLERRVAELEGRLLMTSATRDIERAEQRLAEALPEIDRLESEMVDVARQTDIRDVREAVQQAERDVASLRARLGQAGTEPTALEPFVVALNEKSASIARAVNGLARIHGSGTGLSAPSRATPAGLPDAANQLASEAERMATLAIALHQSAAMIPGAAADAVSRIQLPTPSAPPPPEVTPEEKLRRFAARRAIFFSNGTEFVSGAAASAVLDEATRLIKATNNLVRVVGFTDERGDVLRNDALAQRRADTIVDALVERGVPRQRMVSVGRSGGFYLTPAAGEASPNRRVQFELAFEGENRTVP